MLKFSEVSNTLIQDIVNKDKQNHWSSETEVVQFLISLIHLFQAKSFLEVGSYLGYTSISILNHVSDIQIDTIDLKDTITPYLKKLPAREKKSVHFFQGDSRQILQELIKNKKSYTVIFIDADHSFKGALFDFFWSYFLIKKPGCIVLHDAQNNLDDGVKRLCFWLKILSALTLNMIFTINIYPTPRYEKRPISGLAVINF